MKSLRKAIAVIMSVFMLVCMFTIPASAASSKLAAPTNFKASSITETTVKLKWTKVKKADAYRVYKFNSETDEYETYKTVTGTSCTVKKLKSATTYKFKVAALVKTNGKYKVQTKSKYITVTTKEQKTSELILPKGGEKKSDVLKNYNITNYEQIELNSSDIKGTHYRGKTVYLGLPSEIYMSFNSDDRLYMFGVYTDCSSDFFKTYMNNYIIKNMGPDYTYTNDTENQTETYTWTLTDGELVFGYDHSYETMSLTGFNFTYYK